VAKIHRTFTVHLYDADGVETFEPTGLKTLEFAQRAAQGGLDNEPSVTRAVIEVQRFNGSFYEFERYEEYRRHYDPLTRSWTR
jgi:hypothetical protein